MKFFVSRLCTAALIAAIPVVPAAFATQASGTSDTITVDTSLSQRLLQTGTTQTVYLRIAIRGKRTEESHARTPGNIALVIDRSGSMKGAKIEKAREAARMAINRLDPSDHASVVIFDHQIEALVPARRVKHPEYFHSAIDHIRARGRTAIFAAVEEAVRQIKRYKTPHRFNRIILISDGLANVGPREPHYFQELGEKLGNKGISVSTIGLGKGYNEDLMAQLAAASDGNHAFARTAADLTKIFNQEFDEVLSVSAQDVEIIIQTRDGVTPLRSLGRKSSIQGNTIRMRLNQVYGTAGHALLLALKVDAARVDPGSPVANVSIRYRPAKGERRTISRAVNARYSHSAEDVRKSHEAGIMERVIELQARERARRAVKLRDSGKIEEARKALRGNAERLKSDMRRYGVKSKRVQSIVKNNEAAAASVANRARWNASRKQMREDLSNRQGAPVKY